MARKIEGSLYSLYHLGNQIDILFKAVLEIHSNLDKFNPELSAFDKKLTIETVAIPGLLHNVYILSCSFLDEWNREFTTSQYPEYADRIIRLKKVTKPAFNRINRWTGLKDLRNVVFAHNFRDKKGNDIFTTNEKRSFIFPMSNTETSLLIRLVDLIMTEVYSEFKEIEIDVDKSILSSINVSINHIDTNKELSDITDEINIIKNQK